MLRFPTTISDSARHSLALGLWIVLLAAPWAVHLAAIHAIVSPLAFWTTGPVALGCWIAWRRTVPPEAVPDGESLLGLATSLMMVSTVLATVHTVAALGTLLSQGIDPRVFWGVALCLVIGATIGTWSLGRWPQSRRNAQTTRARR